MSEEKDLTAMEDESSELSAETPETAEEATGPNRESQDRIPVKDTWRIIANTALYAVTAVILLVLMFMLIFDNEPKTLFGWVVIGFFTLAGIAGIYAAYDEVKHLKNAIRLDKEGIEVTATLIDRWRDNYLDYGIASRKKVHHFLYVYVDDHYGKHMVSKTLYQHIKKGSWLKITYLPDRPDIFRPTINF
ncbi:MAG: hypothetical protein JW750_06965 [Anaerolineaceae bacterium]|nr:hypothetical protein [Anaerolineaceae bacterium]